MIYDILISLQNGFENRAVVLPHLIKNNFFDSCIKIGNDFIPQKIRINPEIDMISDFYYIPVLITKNIPCFIGENMLVDLDIFKKEIELVDEIVDLDSLFFISNNTSIKINESIIYLDDLDSQRILNLFGFLPNIIKMSDFTKKYVKPIVEGAGGFNHYDGTSYNRYKNYDNTCCLDVFTYLNIRSCANIIGVFNIINLSKSRSYTVNNDEYLYKYINDKYPTDSEIIHYDYLMSYSWVDLEILSQSINKSGASTVFCIGLRIIKNLDKFYIKFKNEKKEFANVKNNLEKIKSFISEYLNQHSNINELIFI
jgi:hypothetical protein